MRFTHGLDKLKVGQSKLFTNYKRPDSVYKLAWSNAKRTGYKYVCRTMDGGGILIQTRVGADRWPPSERL